jgi:glycine/D-amino acid oxidase-like deaminating enzyme
VMDLAPGTRPAHSHGHMDLHSGAPFWLVRNGLDAELEALHRDERCDVAIVGAGVTGALVADALITAGMDVVMVEQHMPGLGSTAASTALLQYEIDTELQDLIAVAGEPAAVRAYQLGVDAIDDLERLATAIPEGFGFSRRHSLYLASRRHHAGRLEREHQLRCAHGLRTEWWDARRVERTYGFRSSGAIWSADAAQADALRLTRHVLTRACRRGLRLYSRTNVIACETGGRRATITCGRGHRVHARHIIFATGYELPPMLSRTLVRLHSTYALVTEPINLPAPADGGWRGECVVWESARPYFYMRMTDDNRIIAGGEDVPFTNAVARDAVMPERTNRLMRRLRAMVPGTYLQLAFSWAGTFAETNDGLPYIGTVPGHPAILVALGYGGNGITFSAIAARLLAGHCAGSPDRDLPIFRIDR